MLLNVKAVGGSVALGQCGCCGVGSRNRKTVTVKKTFDGACEEVVGELKKFYGEPKMALAEVARAVVERLGFGDRG
jgi:hypothetical protein